MVTTETDIVSSKGQRRWVSIDELGSFLTMWSANKKPSEHLGQAFCQYFGILDDTELNLPSTRNAYALRIIASRYVSD